MENEHTLLEKETKSQREGINTLNCPAAKNTLTLDPTLLTTKHYCPPKGGLAPYQREGVMWGLTCFSLSPTIPPYPRAHPPYPVGKRNCLLHCVSGRVSGVSVAVLTLLAEASSSQLVVYVCILTPKLCLDCVLLRWTVHVKKYLS